MRGPRRSPATELGSGAVPASRVPDPSERPTEDILAAPVTTRSGAGEPSPERSPAAPPASRTPKTQSEEGSRRTLGRALAAAAAATVAPGSGHLILRHTRTGALILGAFLLVIAGLAMLVLTSDTAQLLQTALSTNVLVMAALGCLAAALAWVAVIVRTYLIGRPRGLDVGRQAVGAMAVTALCLVVAAPLGYGANLANSQRNLLNTLFGGGGGTAAAEAIAKPRLNVLLVGSDAGPDRTGARTDTMMVASIDTRTGRTVLFGLPRNIEYAQFPPGSAMAEEFPRGFHDRANPDSGDYLLNAVYAYGLAYPDLAPATPTRDPGLNLLHETISYMLGLQLDYYVEINMAGFASIIDALGGLTMDVGPERIPIGGITPSGRLVRPDGYIEPGLQHLSGEQALAFARSRTGTSDYARMGRQRCLLQTILSQKKPTDVLTNFQGVAAATTNSIATNIPQQVLPALAGLAGQPGGISLESVSFDPSLPDPEEDSGHFNTGDPNFPYMRQVVQDSINRAPAPAPSAAPTPAPSSNDSRSSARGTASSARSTAPAPSEAAQPDTAEPMSLAATCG